VLKVLNGGWNALVMDIRMPRLDGISALKIIRRLEPDLPVLMFTGQAGKGEMSESVALGAFACPNRCEWRNSSPPWGRC
jgi:CheY-like chemotaxis protein